MGNGEANSSGKTEKTSEPQEQPPSSSAAVYPDWSAFQAYYGSSTTGIPPPGFFHSSVASSPQAHGYVWGTQHLIPPYGTPPPPYLAVYPHGGLYAHPSIAPGGSHSFNPYTATSQSAGGEASGPVPSGTEADGKSSDDKGKGSVKQPKGSLGSLNMLTGKVSDRGKASGASNGAFSQSCESRSDGSTDGSDADSKNDSQEKAYCQPQVSTEAVAPQNGVASNVPNGSMVAPAQNFINQTATVMGIAGGMPRVPGPTTNLKIGMDYLGGGTPSPITTGHGKLQTSAVAGQKVPSAISVPRDSSEIWDERELKRQKRKQSNRESARRSRLRKQAECEELAQRVKVLDDENAALRAELNRVKKDLEQLYSENTSLKERLGEVSDGHKDSRSERVNKHAGRDTNLNTVRT